MSTRCQVRVLTAPDNPAGNRPGSKLTLYHHCDGYPEGMIPVIHRAWSYRDQFNDGVTPVYGEPEGPDWRFGRVYKVASLLCWAHPGEFEPLDYHTLHGDIEYFYDIVVHDEKKQMVNGNFVYEPPKWIVYIYDVGRIGLDEKLDGPKLEWLIKSGPIDLLIKGYQ